jgi:hypothetical protein
METTRTQDHQDLIDDGAVLPVGTAVEVRSRFDSRWSRGFAVHAVDDDAYHLQRLSDGAVLPVRFPPADVRVLAAS